MNTHKIQQYKHRSFLQENRQDPITGDSFSIGDEIVFCAECKSAFLKESWEYMEERHCNQKYTLKDFPNASSLLQLQKFGNTNNDDRTLAFLLDVLVAFICGVLVWMFAPVFTSNRVVLTSSPFIASFIYLVFRDCILPYASGSIGKNYLGLYFINTKTQKKAHFALLMMRNLIYWILMSSICILAFVVNSNSVLSLFITVVLIILNLLQGIERLIAY